MLMRIFRTMESHRTPPLLCTSRLGSLRNPAARPPGCWPRCSRLAGCSCPLPRRPRPQPPRRRHRPSCPMSNSCDRNWRGSGASTTRASRISENRLAAVTAGAGTAPAAPAPTPPPPSPEPTAPAQAPEAPAVTTPPPSPEPTAPAPAPQAPLPPTETGGQPVSSSKVFNPDIAVIGNFLGAAGTNHIEDSPSWRSTKRRPLSRRSWILRARRLLPLRGAGGPEVEEGFITFTTCLAACS